MGPGVSVRKFVPTTTPTPTTRTDEDRPRPGLLERLLVEQIQSSGVVDRVGVRSFDHRSVRAVHTLEPRLATSILIAETAPVDPALLAQRV